MNGYVESDAKVKARWEARKKRDDLITAQANHNACLLAETMRDCDHCKFRPDVEPWNVIPDFVTVTNWQIEAKAQERDAQDWQDQVTESRNQ